MRRVERASVFPHRCAVVPYVGASHARGYIDTGSEIPASGRDSHVYVSVVAVEEMARLVGWSPGREVKALVAERDQALERVAELERDLAVAERNLDAVDLLESAGFTSRKKQGRPKAREVAS